MDGGQGFEPSARVSLSRPPATAKRARAAAKPLRIANGDAGGALAAAAVVVPRAGTVWFDYTDLVHYFDDNRMPTGIQRVQIGIFRATLAREAGVAPERIGACSFDPQRRCWVAIPDGLLASVCRAAVEPSLAPGAVDDTWRALTAALRQHIAAGAPAPFAPGDVLVNIGSSWWIPDYLRFVQHLQRERGVLYAAFVHDCIPLRVPEYCAAGLVDEFARWFAESMRMADLVLANSLHTARDIERLAPAVGGLKAGAHVVRLDARFDDGPQPGAVAAARMDAGTHAALGIGRPFALFVATLEARKNHRFVFRCWKAMIEQLGDAVPDLICVGKQGWLFDETQNWLRVHPALAGRIRLVGTVSDHDMAALYRTAQFSVYCSHYEGWGLPVTESLCHGRVPVVPNHTSLPEAGGSFAAYYEPESEASFCEQVQRLLDARTRAAMEARIAARYRPRAWAEVLAQIVTTARHAPLRVTDGAAAMTMRPGCLYSMARPRREAAAVNGERLRYGLGWHAAEDWGTWTRLPQAQLLLRLPADLHDAVLYLLLRGGPAEQTVQIESAGLSLPPLVLHPGQRRLARLLPGRATGEMLVALSASPYSLAPFTGGGDQREIGFGLEAAALAERADAAARVEVLEHFLVAA